MSESACKIAIMLTSYIYVLVTHSIISHISYVSIII